MRHPEILLIPILLLSDYFLTLWGAREAEGKYRLHFRVDHYELNPLWQESVAKRKWLNPRHLALVALVTTTFFWFSAIPGFSETWLSFLFGVYFGAFGSVLGKHLSNLILFRRLKQHPQEIRGELFMTHPLVLSMTQTQYIGVVFPLVLLALFTRHPMVIGAACGGGLLYAVHGIWRIRARRAAAQRARALVAQSPSVQ